MDQFLVVAAVVNAMLVCCLSIFEIRRIRSDQRESQPRRSWLELFPPGLLAAEAACLAAGSMWSATIGRGLFATALLTPPGALVWLLPSLVWGAFTLLHVVTADGAGPQPATVQEQLDLDPTDLHETLRDLADEIVDPLTVILLTMELAESDATGGWNEALSKQIESQARRIHGAVEQLLALALSAQPVNGNPGESVH